MTTVVSSRLTDSAIAGATAKPSSSTKPTYNWAENKTEQTRIILFCDIERPMKWRWAQTINHWVGASLISAASSPNDENDRTGAINRIFKYIHAARDAGQRLKKKNRTLYDVLKYLVIASIFAVIILSSVF